jgi:hypothetical protein
MTTFKPGDRALLRLTAAAVALLPDSNTINNTIVTIVGQPKFSGSACDCNGDVFAYAVEAHDGTHWDVIANVLHPLPPDEEKGSWDEIEKLTRWRPTKVNA